MHHISRVITNPTYNNMHLPLYRRHHHHLLLLRHKGLTKTKRTLLPKSIKMKLRFPTVLPQEITKNKTIHARINVQIVPMQHSRLKRHYVVIWRHTLLAVMRGVATQLAKDWSMPILRVCTASLLAEVSRLSVSPFLDVGCKSSRYALVIIQRI